MLLKRIVLAVGFLWSCSTFAQNSVLNQMYREADLLNHKEVVRLFEQGILSQALLSSEQKIQVLQKVAFAYKQLKQLRQAEDQYRELLKLEGGNFRGDEARIYLYFAQTLASNGKHKEADEQYERFRQMGGASVVNAATAKILSEATISTKGSENYQVEWLNLNTSGPEFSPMYYKNGLIYVANERGAGKKFLDLFYIPNRASLVAKTIKGQQQEQGTLGSDAYTKPTSNDSKVVGYATGNFINAGLGYDERPLSQSEIFSQSLNTKYHEGPATFSKDGSQIIFTRNNYNEGEYRKSSDGVNKLKLYVADLVNGIWQEAKELPFNSDEFSSGHPALSPDNKLLYFASDRPGGIGGTDIYMSRFEAGIWQLPVNLGKELNSKGEEMFPFVDEKGNLYFSTNGRGGLGEADIFFVAINPKTGMPLGKPQNLGSPINSEFDDFGIVTDGERQTGYFSSNRRSSGDNDDILSFVRNGSLFECRELIVSVYDEEGRKTLPKAIVEYEIGEGVKKKTKKVIANENGVVKLCLEEDNDFVFSIKNENYVDSRIGFSTKNWRDDSPTRIEIPLKRILKVEIPRPVGVVSPPSNLVYVANANPSVAIYRGVITAGDDQQPVAGVLVTITSECDGSIQQIKTSIDGSYEFQQEEGCDYIIEASKENFGKKAERIEKTVEKKTVVKSQESRYRVGDVILVDNIFYNSGEWKLQKEAQRELDKIVSTLQRNGSMIIELRSHTDSRGSVEQNRQLSQKRAQAAADYMESRGISRDRLIAKGYGESEPINECVDGVQCTEAEYQRNRRTEFKILSAIQ